MCVHTVYYENISSSDCDFQYKSEQFGEMMPDGRLTNPSDGKKYRLREAIMLSKNLGRPLTEEETEQFV